MLENKGVQLKLRLAPIHHLKGFGLSLDQCALNEMAILITLNYFS